MNSSYSPGWNIIYFSQGILGNQVGFAYKLDLRASVNGVLIHYVDHGFAIENTMNEAVGKIFTFHRQ